MWLQQLKPLFLGGNRGTHLSSGMAWEMQGELRREAPEGRFGYKWDEVQSRKYEAWSILKYIITYYNICETNDDILWY